MAPKYEIGQKVIITPVEEQQFSPRDSDIKPYAGQVGEVTDYYWINLSMGARVVYIYTVRIESDSREFVLHEDEIEAHIE